MSNKRLFGPPSSPEAAKQRGRATKALGMSVLLALGANAKPAVGSAVQAGNWIGEPIAHVIDRANSGGETPELPALDTPYVVQPGDTPDHIAAVSGVQGSQNRRDFDNMIMEQAHAQGHDELQRNMVISVPSVYVDYVENQSNQPDQQ
ncbi:MAG TPA: hypothetical protein VJC09_02975 [Candidatus Saccharimonadales bacterium]|nr:hypothetical protein [Candidatus Saccharimonadales bacterium]